MSEAREMDDCISFLRMGRPHCFEARYDRPPLTAAQIHALGAALAVNDQKPVEIEGARGRIYIGDICTRCGEWRERPPPPQEGT